MSKKKIIPKIGRPRKIKNAKQLEKLINEFLESRFDEDGKNIQPLTMRGFCNYIGIVYDTLLEWEEKREDLTEPIKKLKEIVHEWCESQLYTNARTVGVIFALKNNWGWKDKTEVETKNTNTTLNVEFTEED